MVDQVEDLQRLQKAYSDGITGAEKPVTRSMALKGWRRNAIGPEASAVSIVDEVRAFSNGAGVRDDASVVFFGVKR